MKLDKLTVKAQEAVAAAEDAAIQRHHAEISPEHLLLALLDQEDGVVPRILAKLGADPRVVRADLDQALQKLPARTAARSTSASVERSRTSGRPRSRKPRP